MTKKLKSASKLDRRLLLAVIGLLAALGVYYVLGAAAAERPLMKIFIKSGTVPYYHGYEFKPRLGPGGEVVAGGGGSRAYRTPYYDFNRANTNQFNWHGPPINFNDHVSPGSRQPYQACFILSNARSDVASAYYLDIAATDGDSDGRSENNDRLLGSSGALSYAKVGDNRFEHCASFTIDRTGFHPAVGHPSFDEVEFRVRVQLGQMVIYGVDIIELKLLPNNDNR